MSRKNQPGRTAKRRAWDVIRRLGQFTLPELMAEADIREDNARRLLAELEASGHLARDEDAPAAGRFIVWTVVKDPGAAFLQGEDGLRSPRSRAWQSMRIRGTFRLGDIVATTGIGLDNLLKFVRALEDVGYVDRFQDKDNGRCASQVVFRLVKNTGPEAPIPLRDGRVFDPNRKETVGRHRQSLGGSRDSRRARAWAAIREGTPFTIGAVAEVARMSEDGTRRYIWALERAGIVHGSRIAAAGAPGYRTVYRLVVDLGPEAPRLMGDGRIFDPNGGAIWGASE